MSQRRLDTDLAEQVADAHRFPVRAGVIGLIGVVLMVAIDWLYGGRPSLVAYGAISLAFAVVEATVLNGAIRTRLARIRWARGEQLERDELRRSLEAQPYRRGLPPGRSRDER